MHRTNVLKEIEAHINSLRVIHYSCQALSDTNEGYSPRITSIAVLHVERSVMHSFSIHLIAEELGVDESKIETSYDKLEAAMLEQFFNFVSTNDDARWLHWNMSNINFGFETLSHRFRVLTKKQPPDIPDTRRFNLSSMILQKYGSDCVDHPRMQKLMELNGEVPRDFLNGEQEAEAFKTKEFIRLHKSTMSKAYWFQSMFFRLQENKVVTQRSNLKEKLNRLAESTLAKTLGLIAVVYTVSQLSISGFNFASQVMSKPNIHIEGE